MNEGEPITSQELESVMPKLKPVKVAPGAAPQARPGTKQFTNEVITKVDLRATPWNKDELVVQAPTRRRCERGSGGMCYKPGACAKAPTFDAAGEAEDDGSGESSIDMN